MKLIICHRSFINQSIREKVTVFTSEYEAQDDVVFKASSLEMKHCDRLPLWLHICHFVFWLSYSMKVALNSYLSVDLQN